MKINGRSVAVTAAILAGAAFACGTDYPEGGPAGPSEPDSSGPDPKTDGGAPDSSLDGGADASSPTPVATIKLALGTLHACAIRTSTGGLKCWGSNNLRGVLGLGQFETLGDGPGEMGNALPAVDLGAGRKAVAVSARFSHSCAILDDGSLRCWGSNTHGQLGVGDDQDRGWHPSQMGDALPVVALGTGRTAKEIAVGEHHACAILDDGSVKCWGRNDGGQLGQGDVDHRGSEPGQMGDALPAVALGTGRKAVALALGFELSCALLDNATVKCWGTSSWGALGTPEPHGAAPGTMGDALPPVALGTGRTVKQISAGSLHVCALLDDATVKCWGDNTGGALGLGDVTPRGTSAAQMGDALPVVALGVGRTARAVAAGRRATCALLDNDAVKCWGFNGHGHLGYGDVAPRGSGPGQMGDALTVISLGTGRKAVGIEMGGGTSGALLDDGSIKLWGDNFSGKLGLGDEVSRGDKPGQMGDALPTLDF